MKHQPEIVRNSMINLEDFVNLLARPKNLGIARDGKSVKNSTDTDFEPKNRTKSAYFATYCDSRQNSVSALCYWLCAKAIRTVILALCLLHSDISTVLLAQCF